MCVTTQKEDPRPEPTRRLVSYHLCQRPGSQLVWEGLLRERTCVVFSVFMVGSYFTVFLRKYAVTTIPLSSLLLERCFLG